MVKRDLEHDVDQGLWCNIVKKIKKGILKRNVTTMKDEDFICLKRGV